MDEDSSLRQIFARGKKVFQVIDEGDHNPNDAQKLMFDAIDCFNKVNSMMTSLALISSNEVAQDLNTEDLQYIIADFYLGDLYSRLIDMSQRLRNLESSTGYYFRFLSRCEELHILSQSDLQDWKNQEEGIAPDPGAARQRKIAQFQKEKVLNQRIKDLQEKVDRAEALSEAGEQNEDIEEMNRDLVLVIIEKSVSQALTEMKKIEEEKQLLQRFAPQVQEAARAYGTEEEDERIKQQRQPEEDRRGLLLTHLSKSEATGEVVAQRERFKAGVFQPTVALPTMTLEELAEIEVREAQERDQRAKEAPKPDRRIEQLKQDGEEDDEKLVDIATYKDRAWDNWKDENPKGIGNKAGKIF